MDQIEEVGTCPEICSCVYCFD
uniref:Uncharacterized protein n=1 Tax=Rhizophora mucronata TaxID=61149 RepID=A0A2P2JAE6_RHIMU